MILAPLGSFAPIDMLRDRFELGTTRLFEETLKPGDSVLDIGANVGYFTVLGAKLVGPQGKVFAFEPEPSNYDVLLKNLELNGHMNVITLPKAVSNQKGTAELIISDLDSGFHSLAHLNLPERGTVTVETITIDDFMEENGWPQIDLVKMDIEGGEPYALDFVIADFKGLLTDVGFHVAVDANFIMGMEGVFGTKPDPSSNE